jgi:hypothetical protein
MAGVPIYSLAAVTITGAGTALDILPMQIAGYPPVMIITMTGSGTTVAIEGSHDNVNWVDFSGGGFTSDEARDLVPGVRFWRANVITMGAGGVVTAVVGAAPGFGGSFPGPNAATVAVTATTGM